MFLISQSSHKEVPISRIYDELNNSGGQIRL